MKELLEMGAKIQKTYMQIQRYYESALGDNVDGVTEEHPKYEYCLLCELLLDELKENFAFIQEDL